ncbi:MAG: bicyclomycin resistance protein, partial [Burkholderiales bacterium]|nr:bicyclomycin resistance protein [Burkholderiales bacterium]
GAAAAGPRKVYRYSFPTAESNFDPAKIVDLYSRTVTPHIFEGLLQYDPLARPVKVRPLTAAAMPEASADFRTWTVRIKPGIYFASDPAFKGRRRELVAQDYVYSILRFADPANNSPAWTWVEDFHFLGLSERYHAALDGKHRFDYDTPIEGLQALDRYTLQFKLRDPRPRFTTDALAAGDLLGAVAREVIEHYGDASGAHPVGTGPFRLVEWRRSSFIALERNPEFRAMVYDAEPAADDAEGQAILARMKGRRLPLVDRVEVSIISETQPRWLTFLQRRLDLLDIVPYEFIDRALPGGHVAPYLARQGIAGHRMVMADDTYTYFNMEDPVVGGMTPEKIALRRAIALGVDIDVEIRVIWQGQAVRAQSPIWPQTYGYDPNYKSENGDYSAPRAKALLDLYGYHDRNGDGWRERPDGSPLVLHKATQPDQRSRSIDEQWRRNMAALGLRMEFVTATFQDNLKAARAGKLQMWNLGSLAAGPDGQDILTNYQSSQIDGQNFARFRLPEMDALMQRMAVIADGPERMALMTRAKGLAVVYMPYKYHVHRIANDLTQPWLLGYRRQPFSLDYWQYIDIDVDERRRRGAAG